MNLVISALEKRGLVRRRPDPNHGRVRRTSLTRKGLQVVERCDQSMDAIEADMLGTVAPRSVQAVRAGLYDFAHSLESTSASFARRASMRR
jgi:DNA-binding MarR family transcriptional regulator